MWFVAEANYVPILLALLVGIVVGFWIFRARRNRREEASRLEADRAAQPAAVPPPPPPSAPLAAPRDEGDGVGDSMAAATADVAGEVLGVDAHPDVAEDGEADNLQTLKGVGPKLASQLNAAGITRFAHLARLGPDDLARLDEQMGAFRGRLTRDRVVEQASYLARGDTAGFEATFGKLGG